MLNHVKIGTKLVAAFLFVAVLATTVGVVGMLNIRTIDRLDTRLYEYQTIPVADCGAVSASFNRARINLLKMADPANAADQAQLWAKVPATTRSSVDKHLAEFETRITTDEMRSMYNEVANQWRQYPERH